MAPTGCAPAVPPVDERLRRCAATAPSHARQGDAPDLARGRQLYVTRCAGCHTLVPPSRYPAGRWPAWVTKMAGRASPPLTEEERTDVVAYLRAAARCP